MHGKTTFYWMQDLLEHLNGCLDQWQQADESRAGFWADSVQRDVDELRRLCGTLRSGAGVDRRQTVGV